MITRFFNRTFDIKKLATAGHVRRFTSTATVDGNVQADSRATEILQADFGEVYIGYFETSDPIKEGRKVIDTVSGAEYTVESADSKVHPITGSEYLEVILSKDSSKSDGQYNN